MMTEKVPTKFIKQNTPHTEILPNKALSLSLSLSLSMAEAEAETETETETDTR